MQHREKLEEHLFLLRQLRAEKNKIEDLLAGREETVNTDLLRLDTETGRWGGIREPLNMNSMLLGPETGWRAMGIEELASTRTEQELEEYAAIHRDNDELRYTD